MFSYETSQRLTAQSSEFDVQTKANQLQVAKTNAALKWETYNRKVNEINTLKSRYNTAPDESLLEQIRSAEDSVSQALSDAKTADSDVKTAQIELDKANATATTEKGKLEYDTVKSDTAGTIVSLNTDLPNQSKSKKENETFMEIIDKSKMLVKGNISEFDRDKLKIGQKVEVIDRKDNSKKWTGKVTQVGNLKAEEKAKVKAKVAMTNKTIQTKQNSLMLSNLTNQTSSHSLAHTPMLMCSTMFQKLARSY